MTLAALSLKSSEPSRPSSSGTQTGPSVSAKRSPSVSSAASGAMISSRRGSSRSILNDVPPPVCAASPALAMMSAETNRKGRIGGSV
jgi:hypothetical protein